MLVEESKNDRVMVVDDTPQNLKLLQNMLLKRGYDVFVFPSGRMALKALDKVDPDIVLLDVDMPDIDGYEVCRCFRQTEKYRSVPVIFISVIGELTNVIDGFRAGGVDYITKPFQFEEVDARIKNHIKLHRLRKQLEYQNSRLYENVQLRTKELAEVNAKLKAVESLKSDFLDMISFQMRSQAGGLLSILDELFALNPKTGKWSELFELYVSSRRRMINLLDDAVFLNSRLYDYLQNDNHPVYIISMLEKLAPDNGVELELEVEDDVPLISCLESSLLEKAMDIVFKLAICFNFEKERLNITVNVDTEKVNVSLKLDNVGVDRSRAGDFFSINSSFRASTIAEDMGLSPVVAHRIISLVGGDIYFDYKQPGKCSIEVDIPVGIMHITG